jgi:hypothetical protein
MIIKKPLIRHSNKSYRALSDSGAFYYEVDHSKHGWSCTCLDFVKNKDCKHIAMVKVSLAMRKAAKPKILFNPNRNPRECVYCHGTHTGRHSVRHNVSGDVIRYICHDCHKKYSFSEIKYNYYAIIKAVELSLDGLRLCDIRHELNECAMCTTIRKWIDRFEERMKKYIDTIDAPVIKAKNKTKKIVEINDVHERAKSDMKYLFSLLDDGTKIWLAQESIIIQDAISIINRREKDLSI